MAKYKHLTLTERVEIYSLLQQDKSIRSIAKALKRDPTTIAKEIKKHLEVKETGAGGRPFNQCEYSDNCTIRGVCGAKLCWKFCYKCTRCHLFCSKYKEHVCDRLLRSPYCCNGCPNTRRCHYRKFFYRPSHAYAAYKRTLSERRKGFYIQEEEAKQIERIITKPILQGQSVHHVVSAHKDELTVCEKTIYNYIDGGMFELKNIDLPRKVRYRVRKPKVVFKIDRRCRENRTYEDFLAYLEENPVSVVQMDTVKGGVAGKVLLTLLFVETGLMLAFLRPANTAKSVAAVFNHLDRLLERETFKKLFPVILTDNGSEFSDPLKIEVDSNGEIRTRIFYCQTNRPDQKGNIEVSHEFIRRVIPKGKSLDQFTQDDINLMMSHINSYNRLKLNDRCPYDLFKFLYSEKILTRLGLKRIAADEVNLTPKLLKQ